MGAAAHEVAYGYADTEEEVRYRFEQEALYKRYDGAPDWVTQQFGFPATPTPNSPPVIVGQNPMAYVEAYHHHALDLLGTALDLAAVEGPVLVAGCGSGDAIVSFRSRMPRLQRLIGIDLLPCLVHTAVQRLGAAAEFLVADLFQLQDVVAAGSLAVVYDTVVLPRPLEDNQFFLRGVSQVARALKPDGLLLADITTHPIFCPMEQAVRRMKALGFELVAHRDMNAVILEAIEASEAHFRSCVRDVSDPTAAAFLEMHEAENKFARRSMKQKYMRSIVVFRLSAAAATCPPAPEAVEEDRYDEGVVSWYEQYELEGRAIPDWMRQLSYPCLPPPNLPQEPPVGQNAHFYLDAFYHRIMALAATVIDLKGFEGPCLFTGSGLGGMVPILRAHMPMLRRLVAGDIVPFFLRIAQGRGLEREAELCVLDVLKLDEQFPPSSFQMVIDDAIVSHMRNDGGVTSHLFRPAIQQVRKVLGRGGYFLPNGSLKLSTQQTSAAVIRDIEAEGFRLVATENLTQDCLVACDLMEAHVLGTANRPGCLSDEDRRLYPELVDDVTDSFTEYYRYTMSQGTKGLAHWVFQKL
eukprot:GGOE01000916.1.p1 GENE.GGOE01000916.1~~GGOE01000916.1.p1  ORF type:complete len:580 (-),score=168.92 GGOE01000916.1:260-1999(-)